MSTESAPAGFALRAESMTGLHWLGIVLAITSGVIHLWLTVAFLGASPGLGIGFLTAGVGFLVGVAAVVLDYRRRLFYALGVPFTGGQIAIWYLANAPDFGTTGIADKVVQAILIAVLVVLYRGEA